MCIYATLDTLTAFSPDVSIRKNVPVSRKSTKQIQQIQSSVNPSISRKRLTGGVNGGIINEAALKTLDYRRDYLFPFSLLLQNTRPIGLQVILLYKVFSFLSVTILTNEGFFNFNFCICK